MDLITYLQGERFDVTGTAEALSIAVEPSRMIDDAWRLTRALKAKGYTHTVEGRYNPAGHTATIEVRQPLPVKRAKVKA